MDSLRSSVEEISRGLLTSDYDSVARFILIRTGSDWIRRWAEPASVPSWDAKNLAILGLGIFSSEFVALGKPVLPVTIKRSTLHGTALLALEVLAPDVERAEVDLGEWYEPVPEHAAHYDDRATEFEKVYGALVQD